MSESLPQRRRLYHDSPSWVPDGDTYFVTIACAQRHVEQLTLSEISPHILSSVKQLHTAHKWWCHLCVLMPDHLHGLFSFPPDQSMPRLIERFKSYQSRYQGVQWQSEFFDHRIRDDKEFELKAEYIRQNPVRAGLCDNPEDWPHKWEWTMADTSNRQRTKLR